MTDDMAAEVADSVLFMREAMSLYKGAIVRHVSEHGPLTRGGFIFKIAKKHKPCQFCGESANDGYDLRIERIRGEAAA